jgi:hypothetical protein
VWARPYGGKPQLGLFKRRYEVKQYEELIARGRQFGEASLDPNFR